MNIKLGLMVIAVMSGFVAGQAQAGPLRFSLKGPTGDQIRTERANLEELILSMKGGVSVTTTACIESTGVEYTAISEGELSRHVFVSCLNLVATTQEAYEALKTLFQSGGKYRGIYISVSRL